MNKKGFVLTEVVIVAVFIVTIFIFIYTSIVPLTGLYQDKSEREANIDIVYKLFHVRNMLKKDTNSEEITENNVKVFRCNDLANKDYCNELMRELNLSRYMIAYIKDISDNLEYFRYYNSEIYDYLKSYTSDEGDAILLFDNNEHTIAHIKYSSYNVMGDFPSSITSQKEKITKVYFNTYSKSELDRRYLEASIKANITYDNQGKVLAWLENDSDNSGKYILYIGSVGKTYLYSGNDLFFGYINLNNIYFDNIDTSITTNMSRMFYNCKNLTNLSLTNFNTSNVESMDYMFSKCQSLINIDLSSFNTAKVINMESIFSGCNELTTLSIINFDTRNVTNMSLMFAGCEKITFLNLYNFNTTKVKDMSNMFAGCTLLSSIDINSFNTSNVEKMNQMFYNCSSLIKLDISSFNVNMVEEAHEMFANCINLRTIYVSNSFNFSSLSNDTDMFFEATKLIGGNGTIYNSSYVDKTYARIDREGIPGYFTVR